MVGAPLLVSGCASIPTARAAPDAAPAPAPVMRADLHLHISMERAARPVFRGRSGDGWIAATPETILTNQVDAALLQHAGVRLVFGAVWPPFRIRPGRDARDEALEQLRLLRAFVGSTPGFAIAEDAAQARALAAHGYVAVIPAVEGGEGIGSVEDVDLYFARGARVITLAHFVSNDLAGAAGEQLARAIGLEAKALNDEGLTPLGRAVVKRMMELGMVIDLAHASDRTVRDVLALTEPAGVPVVVCHTGSRALVNTERNISDELALRVAKSGGLIGVSIYAGLVSPVPQSAQLAHHVPGTCDDAIAHWRHLAGVVGAEHLVLGSDFNGMAARNAAGGSCPEGLRHVGDLAGYFAALEAQGIPASAIDGAGGKLLELLERVEEKASPTARAEAKRAKVPTVHLLVSPL